MPTAPVAAASLVLGFGVAQATGVRALGGVVLILALGWCATRWWRVAGAARAAALTGLYVGAFVASHLIADVVGTWGAVLLVAAALAAAAWLVADRRRQTA